MNKRAKKRAAASTSACARTPRIFLPALDVSALSTQATPTLAAVRAALRAELPYISPNAVKCALFLTALKVDRTTAAVAAELEAPSPLLTASAAVSSLATASPPSPSVAVERAAVAEVHSAASTLAVGAASVDATDGGSFGSGGSRDCGGGSSGDGGGGSFGGDFGCGV